MMHARPLSRAFAAATLAIGGALAAPLVHATGFSTADMLTGLKDQAASVFTYDIEMSQADIQSKIDAMPPLRAHKMYGDIELASPKVAFTPANEISLAANVLYQAPAIITHNGAPVSATGRAEIAGSLRYDPATAAFFIQNPRVGALSVEKVPAAVEPKLRELAQLAANEYLSTHPIYVLKDDSLKAKLAKAALKSIRVKDGKIVATLGL